MVAVLNSNEGVPLVQLAGCLTICEWRLNNAAEERYFVQGHEMQGEVKTYLPEKKYGFIKGDDGKDYFFHENDFRKSDHQLDICEGARVEFDQQATPKGYRARKCMLLDPSATVTYVVPDTFLTSRSGNIRNWEIVEPCNWVVHGTSVDSPDDARQDVIDSAKRLGANAILDLQYYKTRGSNGNYYYTIHNFRGRPVIVAKRNARGNYSIDDLLGLETRARELKEELSLKSRKRRRIFIGLSIGLSAISSYAVWLTDHNAGVAGIVAIGGAVLTGIFAPSKTYYDWWLEKA